MLLSPSKAVKGPLKPQQQPSRPAVGSVLYFAYCKVYNRRVATLSNYLSTAIFSVVDPYSMASNTFSCEGLLDPSHICAAYAGQCLCNLL